MEERVSLDDAKEAAALIGKALTARSHTGKDEDYAALLARWNASMLFRNLVSRMAAGLGLSVVGELEGESGTKLILRPNGPESPFTALPGDLTDPQHDLRRGEFAIILAGVAAAYFRTAADVSTPQDHDARLTPAMVAGIVREICARAAEADEGPPMRDSPLLLEGWRQIRSKPEILQDEQRANRSSLHGIVRLAMNRLADHDMLVKIEIGDDTFYLPTARFRMQLRETLKDDIFRTMTNLASAVPAEFDEPGERFDA
ncbi:MAG: hypothetical protein ACLFWF_02790 [Alphaproteobacteria bacterium]